MTTDPFNPPADEKPAKGKKSPAGAQARYAAIQRLIALHKDEFNRLYNEEAENRGVRTRSSTKAARIAKLEAALNELKES